MSTDHAPKQFQKFYSEKTLIQETYERVSKVVDKNNIWISTGEKYCETVLEQIPEFNKDRVICEPSGKNSAPAIGLLTLLITKDDPEASIATIASDHFVGKPESFTKALNLAFNFIEKNPEYFATVGINPTKPDPGLGYIKMGEQLQKKEVYRVDKFIEKPPLEKAIEYSDSWEYLWNAAYFIYKAENFMKDFERLLPKMTEQLKDFIAEKDDTKKIEIWESIDREPIETTVIEKLENIAVIPADLNWSDIGNWASLHELITEGKEENYIQGNHHGIDTNKCLIFAPHKKIFTIGLDDIVIVDTKKALMICHKGHVQKVKDLVDLLKEEGLEELL